MGIKEKTLNKKMDILVTILKTIEKISMLKTIEKRRV